MHAGPGTPVGEDKELALKLAEKYNITLSGAPVDPKYDWPHLVAQYFNAVKFCGGIAGINFFHSYEHYLNTTQDEDIIIFCVSEPLRVINKHRLPINKAWLDEIYKQTNMGKFILEYTAKCANLVDITKSVRDVAIESGPRYDINERNHFTQEQNIRMSEMVIDIIKTDNFIPGPIDMEKWFTLNKEERNQDVFYDDIFKSYDLMSKEDDFIYP
jgi:hypothetical protein